VTGQCEGGPSLEEQGLEYPVTDHQPVVEDRNPSVLFGDERTVQVDESHQAEVSEAGTGSWRQLAVLHARSPIWRVADERVLLAAGLAFELKGRVGEVERHRDRLFPRRHRPSCASSSVG